MSQFIKIPIAIVNSKQIEIGIGNPEEIPDCEEYFDPNEICGFRAAHDDTLQDMANGMILEATAFYLKCGESFVTYMHISDFIKLLNP